MTLFLGFVCGRGLPKQKRNTREIRFKKRQELQGGSLEGLHLKTFGGEGSASGLQEEILQRPRFQEHRLSNGTGVPKHDEERSLYFQAFLKRLGKHQFDLENL